MNDRAGADSLQELTGQLRSMRLREEPGQVLGRTLVLTAEILRARRVILLFYDGEGEQLYRWDCRPGDAEPTRVEVPPAQLGAWIALERTEVTETLGADDPLCARLDANLICSIRFVSGPNCGRLLAVDPAGPAPEHLAPLGELAGELAPLTERFFTLRHVRAQAIDEERNRIAQDFHDGPLQAFLGFEVQLQFIRRLLDVDPARAALEVEQLQALARKHGREMRDLLQEMRLIDLDGGTLLALLRQLVQDLEKSGDIQVKLLADSHRVEAPRGVCRQLFHIVREAVTNARKHGGATHIVINVDSDPDLLKLSIDDNGGGFTFSGSYTLEEMNRLRLGPVSIKQRAQQLGASLIVESTPGHGSRLLLSVPLAGPQLARAATTS